MGLITEAPAARQPQSHGAWPLGPGPTLLPTGILFCDPEAFRIQTRGSPSAHSRAHRQ